MRNKVYITRYLSDGWQKIFVNGECVSDGHSFDVFNDLKYILEGLGFDVAWNDVEITCDEMHRFE